jgi:hypothetical protein
VYAGQRQGIAKPNGNSTSAPAEGKILIVVKEKKLVPGREVIHLEKAV